MTLTKLQESNPLILFFNCLNPIGWAILGLLTDERIGQKDPPPLPKICHI